MPSRKNVAKSFIGRLKKPQKWKSYAWKQPLKGAPWNKVGKTPRPRKVQEGEILFKICGNKVNIFFLATGFFLAIVWALQLGFYINLPNFSRNRKYAYFLVNIFWRIRKRNDAMNLFTLFRNISFFYWFVWEFLGNCSWAKTSLKMLNLACCLLHFARYSLLFGCCSLLSARCSLLSPLCLLNFAKFFSSFLLIFCCIYVPNSLINFNMVLLFCLHFKKHDDGDDQNLSPFHRLHSFD